METNELELWLDRDRQERMLKRLIERIGLTRARGECFLRLWIYLSVKEQREQNPHVKPPLLQLTLLDRPVSCSHREAAELFYSDRERGSDRSAGMMLDKLAALGLIRKQFDGNISRIEILAVAAELEPEKTAAVEITIEPFDPRCDAIPVANLLATNYNWMNRNTEATPHRIVNILREWARQYDRGMRVLRRQDNLNPIGFYLLYPTASISVPNFFIAPSKSLHLSAIADMDPFVMAQAGDMDCASVFIRSWAIERDYIDRYRVPFLEDTQKTLIAMQSDFPNLCDLYTMIIHPTYEQQATALGFQSMSRDRQLSLYWMYLPVDRFLSLNIASCFPLTIEKKNLPNENRVE
jgi:hypothetical protein